MAGAISSAEPLESLQEILEVSALGGAIRSSVWIYPTVNVLHVLAVIVTYAVIAAMDMRILLDRTERAGAFVARLRPWAVTGLGLLFTTGFLLFVPEATHIGSNPVFQIKLVTIALALINVAVLEIALRRRASDGSLPRIAKGAALASLLLWLAVAAFGRLIAYF